MADHLAAYQGIRTRVTELTGSLDDATAEQIAPATPEWRIKDVVAHLVGVNADVLSGNIEGAGTDPWTAVQVEARRDRSLAELLAEWQELAEGFDAIVPHIPEAPRGQLIFDAVTHELDLRGALDVPGARDSEAMAIAFDWAADIVALMRDQKGTGALVLRTEQGDRVAGTGEATATVAADRFELFRAMTGRRSAEQIAAYSWEGDDAARRPFPFFAPRPTPLVE